MAFEFFKVPVHAPGAFADELNAFIAGHRVASVRKKFVRKKRGPALKGWATVGCRFATSIVRKVRSRGKESASRAGA